jgi:hypothetical protein
MSNHEPAFPRDHDADGHNGMTLRDYFAAKVMAAAIAHHGIYDEEQPLAAMTSATAQDYHAESVAKIAYTYADEMLAARERA